MRATDAVKPATQFDVGFAQLCDDLLWRVPSLLSH